MPGPGGGLLVRFATDPAGFLRQLTGPAREFLVQRWPLLAPGAAVLTAGFRWHARPCAAAGRPGWPKARCA
jgi:hypothetical protein